MKHLRIILLVVLFIFTSTYCLTGQSSVIESLSVESEIIGHPEKYSIYLPDEYNTEKEYPVIFLLHGFGGNENSFLKSVNLPATLDSLIHCQALPPVIVIFPNGNNSYFMNDYNGLYKFEDYFITEFLPTMDSTYPISTQQNMRAIGGISMGGFGAVLLPIKHPKLFGTSINLSGAVRTQQEFINMNTVKYHKNFAPLYGPNLLGKERITAHWLANSPYSIIDSTYDSTLKKINWYFDCGNDDFLFSANKKLHKLYLKFDIEHEYHVRSGNHSWNYWHESIILALTYWGEYIKTQNTKTTDF